MVTKGILGILRLARAFTRTALQDDKLFISMLKDGTIEANNKSSAVGAKHLAQTGRPR